jgi:hypothetical protein
MKIFGKKYVQGITQFIQADHFGTMDFIDYHCQKMGISRNEYMAYYGIAESLNEEEKQSTDKGPIDDEKIETALKTKAEETGVPIGIIRAVMRRGMAAWKTGHRPGANQQQWGYARVNSFLTKGEGTWGKADSDLAKEVRDAGKDGKLKKA